MTYARRWSIFIVDDLPDGSPEGRFKELLYLWKAPGAKNYTPISEALRDFLPEPYFDPDEADLSVVDFRGRRQEMRPRRPVIDVARTFAEAWTEFEPFPDTPPDIVLLDVKLDQASRPEEDQDVRAICTTILRENEELTGDSTPSDS